MAGGAVAAGGGENNDVSPAIYYGGSKLTAKLILNKQGKDYVF